MRINTNINSMRTQEYMRQNQAKMSNSMDRLSSGKRINSAADDAAGLAIATRMKAREGGLNVAARNTQDGMSLIRTADSALNSVSNILLRMRDLANQSATGTNTTKNQVALNKEFAALKEQITYIADNTQFNDKNLLKSTQEIKIQTLDSDATAQQIGIKLEGASLTDLGIADLSIETALTDDAKKSIEAFDKFKADYAKAANLTDQKAAVAAFGAAFKAAGFDSADATKVTTAATGFATAATDPTTAAKGYTDIVNAFDAIKDTAKLDTAKPSALNAVGQLDAALTTVADNRATLGATLNRLDFNVNNLKSQENSMAASASQIEDADMAKEMSEMTKFKILNEAGISMLSQANQTPQMVSKLLQ
ncbi:MULTISPECIES: flagellin N-terminal helical domain-containing protein [Bacillus cereus group]|uniref:flagellin N-terminal helical domain-containing protein n=1 Tax=Bacillus cereus group TaxID=86661 RepID=UPI0007B6C809|nr:MULTISPECIES: flagellin [Bacillus cereus group]ANC07151.1 flagellin [Bacillus cereus]ANC12976.1 flagellin [Bacillus cereus]MDA1993262.1 flagellin [Bacillus cereus]MDA1998809.1 flagellin [Bacillus cereus]MDA2514508.1 flagellin [Bacillus cereus]